ncbi:hypothetical protein SETIT_7G102900v2 [Setaria italica]|uniref:Uncharacterized protein n=1 Tax=Setaria italica TaxID=4555 RepID=A0A368RU85_SETIT|nr:hypothetical protein SETIT_7G102900v2 [Setaria italica]
MDIQHAEDLLHVPFKIRDSSGLAITCPLLYWQNGRWWDLRHYAPPGICRASGPCSTWWKTWCHAMTVDGDDLSDWYLMDDMMLMLRIVLEPRAK